MNAITLTLTALLLAPMQAFAAPQVKFNETVLGKHPLLATPRMGFSPDGKRVAWAARDGAKARIEINGVPAFTAETVERLFFTPDSNHWIALERRGPKWDVVFDGSAGPLFDRVENFVFNPAGDRLAYVGTRGTRQVPVIGGIEGQEHDHVFGLTWAGDGRVIFAAYDGGSAQLMIDGVRVGQTYKTMSVPAVSDDGKNIAMAVRRADGRELVVVNGVEGSLHEKALNLTISRDGKHTAYVGLDDLARVYLDEKPGAAHPSIGPIVISPDGARIAYSAFTEDNKMLVVIDGAGEPQHTHVDALLFSPDSKRLLYTAADPGRGVIVADSVEVGPFDDVPRSSVMFGAGGARWTAIASLGGKELAVIDGVTSKPYDLVRQPVFSQDGRLVAFTATRDGRTILLINGTEFVRYKKTVPVGVPLHFANNRLLTLQVLRGNEVVRVDADIIP